MQIFVRLRKTVRNWSDANPSRVKEKHGVVHSVGTSSKSLFSEEILLKCLLHEK